MKVKAVCAARLKPWLKHIAPRPSGRLPLPSTTPPLIARRRAATYHHVHGPHARHANSDANDSSELSEMMYVPEKSPTLLELWLG